MAARSHLRTSAAHSQRPKYTIVRRCLSQVQKGQTESRHYSTEITECSNLRRSNLATGKGTIRFVHFWSQQTAATGGDTVQPTPVHNASTICTAVRCRSGATKSPDRDASHETDAASAIQRPSIVQCTQANLRSALDSTAGWTKLREQLAKRHTFPRCRHHAVEVSGCVPSHPPWYEMDESV
jgi:hypothetical protein